MSDTLHPWWEFLPSQQDNNHTGVYQLCAVTSIELGTDTETVSMAAAYYMQSLEGCLSITMPISDMEKRMRPVRGDRARQVNSAAHAPYHATTICVDEGCPHYGTPHGHT